MALVYASDQLGRTDSFDQGKDARRMEYARQGFKPDSVLQPIMSSDNGFSERDADRRLLHGATLPTSNGMSENTYKKRQPLLSPYSAF